MGSNFKSKVAETIKSAKNIQMAIKLLKEAFDVKAVAVSSAPGPIQRAPRDIGVLVQRGLKDNVLINLYQNFRGGTGMMGDRIGPVQYELINDGELPGAIFTFEDQVYVNRPQLWFVAMASEALNEFVLNQTEANEHLFKVARGKKPYSKLY